MSEKMKRNGKSFSKWIAAAALTALFILNIGFNVDVSFDDGWMPNVEINATTQVMAQDITCSGSFALQPGSKAKNKACVKEVNLGGVPPVIGFKAGFRDKCKDAGSGCCPTACL